MTEQRVFLSLMARSIPKFELTMDLDMEDKTRPIDEQIVWNRVSAVCTPKDGTQIRIIP